MIREKDTLRVWWNAMGNFYTGDNLVRYGIMSKKINNVRNDAHPDNVQKSSFVKKLKSSNLKTNFIRDILSIVVIVAMIGCVMFGVSGTWPAIVAVQSKSMVPNMNVGDLIFIVEENRFGALMTSEEAKTIGVKSFNDYGDVIIYRPNGNANVTPFIHRVLTEINESTAVAANFAHAGYITKGDHNPIIDQGYTFPHMGMMQPIKKEWILGKALFAIPLVGYLPLHIWKFVIAAAILLMILELYKRKREKNRKITKNHLKKGGQK
jgi:signal peptidase